MFKALSSKSLNWISATRFAELVQFGQDPKFTTPELSEEKIEWCFIKIMCVCFAKVVNDFELLTIFAERFI